MRMPGAYIYDGTGYAKGGVGVFAVYITSRMLSAVPALWFAGCLMKHRLRVPGRLIPYALAVLGVVLLLLFAVYMYMTIRQGFRNPAPPEEAAAGEPENSKGNSMGKDILLLVVGAALVAVGADLLVDNGTLIAKALGVPAGIIDLSLAPTPAIGDSVANILEEMGLETCGCCGTTACLALLNDDVKKGGVMASNHVGGLSGAFIPVSEDAGMIHAAEIGCLTIEKLEAMTAVCSVGIDMVIIPGDTTPAVISALIADEAAIGMVNSKTTAVRVIPAIGRKAGEVLDFGGLLGYGPIMAVNQHDPSVFINRGGRLPAPMQSLKN